MKAKIDGLIKKFKIELASKDGKEGLAVRGKPSAAEVAELKELKSEIMAELKRRKAERAAEIEAVRAKAAARLEQKKQEYLATADLRRCLVCRQDEMLNVTWSIATLSYNAEQDCYFSAEYGLANYVALEHVTAMIEEISQRGDSKFYGLECVAWEITPDEEKALLAEQAPAKEKAEKEAAEAAEKKAAEEAAQKAAADAARQAKFERARETGRPVLLAQWTEPCNDPREECSLDIVQQYAMPDGSVKTERNHTW
jgi:hypothetical protein